MACQRPLLPVVGDIDHTRGPRFNQSSLVLEAAILGRGVAVNK